MKFLDCFFNLFGSTSAYPEVFTAHYWLIVAFFFLIMEMGSPGLFFFSSFFFGGLIASAVSLCIPSIIVQMTSFFVGTSVALLVLRYWIVPRLGKDRPHERTNVYALKGKQGFVVAHITFENPGLVKVNGELWAAKVARGESAAKGDLIEVIDMRGAHVVVKKVSSSER